MQSQDEQFTQQNSTGQQTWGTGVSANGIKIEMYGTQLIK